MPNQWLPVVESDMQKFSSIRPTSTYSDAYVNGMPAKRRKLLFSKSDLLTKNLLKRVLSRTLEKMQPKASNDTQEQLVSEGLSQSRLVDSFDVEFDAAITQRLRHDSEFAEITQKKSKTQEEDNDDEESLSLYNEDRFQNSKKRLN